MVLIGYIGIDPYPFVNAWDVQKSSKPSTCWSHARYLDYLATHQALQHAATLMPPDIGIDIQEGLKLHNTYAWHNDDIAYKYIYI